MKKEIGFTLIELLIAMLIIGVLLTVGVPSLKSFMQGNQLIASTNELLSALHVARSSAIKHNKRVTVCESDNGTTCNDPATFNWRKGWVVLIDENGDGIGTGSKCINNTSDCLLRSHDEILDSNLSVSGIYDEGGKISSFTFTSRGLPKDTAGISQSGVYSICSFDGSPSVISSRAVVLSISGRARVSDNSAIINCPAAPF